jgi:hypothetical protein
LPRPLHVALRMFLRCSMPQQFLVTEATLVRGKYLSCVV